MAGILIEAAVASDQGGARGGVRSLHGHTEYRGSAVSRRSATRPSSTKSQRSFAVFRNWARARMVFSTPVAGPSRPVHEAGTSILPPGRTGSTVRARRSFEPWSRSSTKRASDLVILSESAVAENAEKINQLIDHSAGNLQGLLGIAADANWLAGLLRQASLETDKAATGQPRRAHQRRYSASRRLQRHAAHARCVGDGTGRAPSAAPGECERCGSHRRIGARTSSIFEGRQRAAIELTGDLEIMLTQAVNEIVGLAYVDVRQSSDAVQQAITSGRWLLAMLSGSALVIAIAVVLLYVGPNIVAPITGISRSVARLARGEQVPVPGSDRHDELGDLARSLGVIHDQAIRATRIKLGPRQRRLADHGDRFGSQDHLCQPLSRADVRGGRERHQDPASRLCRRRPARGDPGVPLPAEAGCTGDRRMPGPPCIMNR